MTVVWVLAEDEDGDMVRLQLHQQVDEPTRSAKDVVGRGSILVVKEPFFELTASGGYGI